MSEKSPPTRILLVSWPILPGRGGSVIIIEKLMNYFSSQEVVLFGELSPFGKAPYRAPDRPQAHYFRSGFSLFGRGARFFAWFRWLLLQMLVKKICRVAIQEKCDYILAVFPDDYYAYAAVLAAQKLGLPFSSFLHNTYTDNDAVDQKRGKIIQPLLFEESEVIFVANDGMKKFYEEKYGFRNVVTLVHTFENIPAPPAPPEVPLAEKEKVKLVLIGNFNSSNLEATQRFVEAVSKSKRYEIYMYTHVPVPLLKMRGIDTNAIHHMGYIKDANLIDELRKYDIVVLTHGFTGAYGETEYKTIFPVRTVPLMLSGRPMLVHSPKVSFLSDFAREHNFGCLVDEPSEKKIIEGLDRIVNDSQYASEIIEGARETSLKYYGPNVAAVMRATLGMDSNKSAEQASSASVV